MLDAIRQLSLWMLADQLGATGDVEQWYDNARKKHADRLLAWLTELVFLWADFGRRIDNVRGVVSDVLPSRLRELDELNVTMTKVTCSAFPDHPVEQAKFDLALSAKC